MAKPIGSNPSAFDGDAGSSRLRELVASAAGRDIVTPDELRRRLLSLGRRISEDDLADHLQLDTRFAELDDGLCFTPAVFDGVTFVADVSELDAESGLLAAKPCLEPITWWLVEGDVELRAPDGSRLGVLHSTSDWRDGVDTDLLEGPEGWLDGMAGRHIALTVTDRALVLHRDVVAPSPSAALADSIARAAALVAEPFTFRTAGGDELEIAPADVSRVCHRSAFYEPEVWTDGAVRVGADLFAAAGLKDDRMGLVALHLDDDTLRVADRQRSIAFRHGLDGDTAFGVSFAAGLANLLAGGEPPADLAAALGIASVVMADPRCVDAVADEAIVNGSEPAMIGLVDAIAEEFGADVGTPEWCGLSAVGAICRLAVDDVDRAADALDTVPEAFESLLVASARMQLAWERSDAAGVRHWAAAVRRHHAADEPRSIAGYRAQRLADGLVEQVDVFTSIPRAAPVGRNDPCPCGSGKKFKRCHLNGGLLSPAERESWVYGKLVRYVLEHCDEQRWAVAEQVASASFDAVDEEDVVDSPIVIDIVATTPGTIGAFLSGRLDTLDPAEVLIANQWELSRPTVIEVESLGRDRLHVFDLLGGERRVITNVVHGQGMEEGVFAIATLLSADDEYRVIGGYTRLAPTAVDRAVAELIDADPLRHAAFVGSLFARPRVANTDGHDLDPQRLVWDVPDIDDAVAALVAAGFSNDDDDHSEQAGGPVADTACLVLVRDSANQRDTVIASAELERSDGRGARLEITVNSAERSTEMTDLVGRALRDASFVGAADIDEDIDVGVEVPDHGAGMLPSDATIADPAVLRAVEEHIRAYEREWLDTEVPALGGRTPRDAAGDPVGREQLERLLASFPEPPPGAIGMSARRLRDELGF